MITTTTAATCISVIHDIVIVIIWWCDLQLHMSYITEIQGAVVVVIICWVIYNYICHELLKYKGHNHNRPLYFSNI
jgi:membrane protein YdbS with pleckstrin-like domain